jgi:hypothetical protein
VFSTDAALNTEGWLELLLSFTLPMSWNYFVKLNIINLSVMYEMSGSIYIDFDII